MATTDMDACRSADRGNDDSNGPSESTREINERFTSELPLVELVAKRVWRAMERTIQFDELITAGREGLFEAARRFNPQSGASFRTYASYRVEGAMFDAVRAASRLPRRLHERVVMLEAANYVNEGDAADVSSRDNARSLDMSEASLGEQLATIVTAAMMHSDHDRGVVASDEPQSETPEDAYAHAELMAMVRTAIGELDEFEANVIRCYYFEDKSYGEAADAMKISKPWAHRVHAKAMDRLTKRLRAMIRD
ncbi:MAG TPA: sigma-70 family RNA polymerase sigma factor [Polyangiaceae bacterium]|nr:sigma-70 family RNA polymerase sigma factor [Polyangiaceae bacterium]